MKEDYILILVGIICILGFVYLLHHVSKREGFEDIRMDLGDGDRGSDAWYENGTHRAGVKFATIIPKDKPVDKKEVVQPSQAPATARAAPAIRETAKAAKATQAAQAAQATQAAQAAQVAQAAQAAQATQAAQAAQPAQDSPAVKRVGAAAKTAGMPSTTGTPVEKTKLNYAPVEITGGVTSDAGQADAGQADVGPELTAANTAKPAIPQINSRVNEDMCRVVMNCGLTKL